MKLKVVWPLLYRPSAAAPPSLSEWNGTCVDDVVQVFAMKYHLIKSMWSAGHLPNDEDDGTMGWTEEEGTAPKSSLRYK